jgi:hypothetical protein
MRSPLFPDPSKPSVKKHLDTVAWPMLRARFTLGKTLSLVP